MPRVIRRYGSRKLYDIAESRYVGLDEIAAWIRGGTEVRVVAARTGHDVTSATLTQIISDEERRGVSGLGSDFLHQVVRRGGEALVHGVERLEHSVERAMQASIDNVRPLRHARAELEALRASLGALDRSLATLEQAETEEAEEAGRRR